MDTEQEEAEEDFLLKCWRCAEVALLQDSQGPAAGGPPPGTLGELQSGGPHQGEVETQGAAAKLIKTFGGPYGIACAFCDGDNTSGAPEAESTSSAGPLALGLCDCALRGLHAATLRCTDTWKAVFNGQQKLPFSLMRGSLRLLLILTGALHAAGQAEGHRRLLSFTSLLRPPETPTKATSSIHARPAWQFAAAAAAAMEELRALRLPLLLHPKATEMWALRRQQLRLCVALLQQPEANLQQQQRQDANLVESAAPAAAGCSAASVAWAALQREQHLLLQDDTEGVSCIERGEALLLNDNELLLLQLVQAELSLAAWHLRARPHSYQAAEHAHRVLQFFISDIAAAAKAAAVAPVACSSKSPETEMLDRQNHHHQQQQQQQDRSLWLSRLATEMQIQERAFWKRMSQTFPFHFAGGQQLLRLLSSDLKRLLQQQLQQQHDTAAPLEASWVEQQLRSGGAAAARVAETADEGRRLVSFFPACEAAWRLVAYSFVALMDWAEAAAASCSNPQEVLQTVVGPTLEEVLRAETQWVKPMADNLFSRRHIETLKEEMHSLLNSNRNSPPSATNAS